MNPNVIASFALISSLAQKGVKTAVISPGSRSTPLAYAVNKLLDVLVVIDERDAGFCALGIAESTKKPVVVITTSGSAPTHLFPSITESFGSSVPLIIISSDRPHEVRGRGAPQTIDQIELFSTHVQFFLDTPCPTENSDPNYWAGIGAELYESAMGTASSMSCPGPAHLNMGFSEHLVPEGGEENYVSEIISKLASQPISKSSFGFTAPTPDVSTPIHKDIEAMISAAKRVLITAGRNAGVEILKSNGLLVLADVTSGLRHDDQVITCYDSIMRTKNLDELQPDLIIQIGEPLTSKKFNEWVCDIKVISIKHSNDGRNPYGNLSEVMVAEKMQETVSTLLDLISENTTFIRLWSAAEVSVKKIIDSKIIDNTKSEPALFFELGKTVANIDSPINVMLGSSMPIRYCEWFWSKLKKNSSVYSHRGTNGIDGILSSTLGIAYGTKRVTICVCGDLTFAHDIGFLSHCVALSKQLDLKIIFVVVDNNGGAIFKHLPQGQSKELAESYSKLIATPTSINFEALALACGAKYKSFDIEDIQQERSDFFDIDEVGTTLLHAKVQYDSGYEFMKELDKDLGDI